MLRLVLHPSLLSERGLLDLAGVRQQHLDNRDLHCHNGRFVRNARERQQGHPAESPAVRGMTVISEVDVNRLDEHCGKSEHAHHEVQLQERNCWKAGKSV